MGTLLSLLSEAMPPSPKWSVDDIPDLGGMVVIVTGGNSGIGTSTRFHYPFSPQRMDADRVCFGRIGKETVHHLLTHNAKVYMACRSPSKASAAAADLKKSTGKGDAELVVLQMDLGDLASVKGAVEEFLSYVLFHLHPVPSALESSFVPIVRVYVDRKESRLDILYNNAGIMYPPHSLLTSHGHDAQFGTNVLGPYYLTTLLLPLLIATASSSILVSSPTSSPSFPSASRDGSSSAKGSGKGSGKGNATGKVRIVNLASSTHLLAPSPSKGGPVIMDSLVPGRRRDGMSTVELYCQSKAVSAIHKNLD